MSAIVRRKAPPNGAAAIKEAGPVLRWAGSKRWLGPHLQGLSPITYERYIEPFLGSASIFLHFDPPVQSILSDSLEPLINFYTQVRDNPADVVAATSEWPVDKETFYILRALAFSEPSRRAAQFLYLNKVGFNGLYRVNQQGQYNVPYGRPKTSNIASIAHVMTLSSRLKHEVELVVQDFQDALETARPGDLVVLDPPYATAHTDNGFVDYNAHLFSWKDQRRLADIFRELDRSGVYVIQTNADHPSIRSLYSEYDTKEVGRFSSMAANASRRSTSRELLILGNAIREASAV